MIYFVRHGECEANRDRLFAGTTDSPLTTTGKDQALHISRELVSRNIVPARIVSSSLPRALQTAQVIIEGSDLTSGLLIIDSRLNEYDFGILNGMPKEGIDSDRFMATPDREQPVHFYNRLREAWNEYCDLSGDTLIVSHSFVRLGIECALDGEDIEHFHNKASHHDTHLLISEYNPTPIR